MNPELYHPIYMAVTSVIALVLGVRYLLSDGYELQEHKGNFLWPLHLALFLALWLGFRPISAVFTDMLSYSAAYNNTESHFASINWKEEWLWQWINVLCKILKLTSSQFFVVIELGYILFSCWAVKRLMPLSPMTGLIFLLLTFSFFSYGTNTIRNGLACSLLLLALSYILNRNTLLIGVLLALAAFGIHRSTLLPIVSFCCSMLIYRKPILFFYIWLGAVIISLIEPDYVIRFISALNIDNRIEGYSSNSVDPHLFSHVGYRWDFLIYGAIPVIVAWYYLIRKEVTDVWYSIICGTYILSNSVWIIFNQISFSDRFAYLSWFLYPVVVAYPLLNLPVWDKQDRYTGSSIILYLLMHGTISLYLWLR